MALFYLLTVTMTNRFVVSPTAHGGDETKDYASLQHSRNRKCATIAPKHSYYENLHAQVLQTKAARKTSTTPYKVGPIFRWLAYAFPCDIRKWHLNFQTLIHKYYIVETNGLGQSKGGTGQQKKLIFSVE